MYKFFFHVHNVNYVVTTNYEKQTQPTNMQAYYILHVNNEKCGEVKNNKTNDFENIVKMQ